MCITDCLLLLYLEGASTLNSHSNVVYIGNVRWLILPALLYPVYALQQVVAGSRIDLEALQLHMSAENWRGELDRRANKHWMQARMSTWCAQTEEPSPLLGLKSHHSSGRARKRRKSDRRSFCAKRLLPL